MKCSLFVFGYSLWGGDISGSGSKFNCAARVGSDDLGYGPGSGFNFKPVQTSSKKYISIVLFTEVYYITLHASQGLELRTAALVAQ